MLQHHERATEEEEKVKLDLKSHDAASVFLVVCLHVSGVRILVTVGSPVPLRTPGVAVVQGSGIKPPVFVWLTAPSAAWWCSVRSFLCSGVNVCCCVSAG